MSNSLHKFARFNSFVAFFLLIAGGLVTSTGSGLSVPDWPLSYGQYFPAMVGGVFFEHGHRMIAGAVGLMTWALAAWIMLREPRRWVRRLAAAAAFGIALQALLGGITVLYGLPPQVSVVHACLGQAIFCMLLCLAEATSWDPGASLSSKGPWRVGAVAVSALFLQLIFGAILRHTGSALAWHLAGAVAAFTAVSWLVRRSLVDYAASALQGPSMWLLWLLPMQVVLGLAAYMLRPRRLAGMDFWPSVTATAHVACGALLLGVSVVWTLRALREEKA